MCFLKVQNLDVHYNEPDEEEDTSTDDTSSEDTSSDDFILDCADSAVDAYGY